MYGALDISTSGMIAQRTRLDSISANIANRNTILDASGRVNPYRRREVYFAPGDPSAPTESARQLGVHVSKIEANDAAVRWLHDPRHPYANAEGYVAVPDIDPVVEQINAMEAVRAYEANVAAAEATKAMLAQALRLIA